MLWLIFLCWGSFLNFIAYRLIFHKSFFTAKSYCPHCKQSIAWYDLIPVVSWIILKAHCRQCKKTISWLYPFIELITAISCTLLFYQVSSAYFASYFFFFSALIVTIRTDLETMLISRFVSLYAVPIGFLCAYLHLLPISLYQSTLGAITGFLFLWLVAHLFYKITGKIGMGDGDPELLAFIGSFTGFFGWWTSLLLASLLGSLIGIPLALYTKNRSLKLPFGPFLAFGALTFVLFQRYILAFFFC